MKSNFHNSFRSFIILCGMVNLFTSCATRQFVCKSIPEHALITAKMDTSLKSGTIFTSEAPATFKLQFWGKDSKYYLIAEKRGYYPETKLVTKRSELSNTFTLKKIDGVSELTYPKENLKNASFYLLPPKIIFVYHKGAGAFERYENDDDVAKKIKENLLRDITNSNKPALNVLNFEGKENCKTYIDKLPEDFFDYLFDLDKKRLDYYARPANVELLVKKFGDFRDALQNHASANGHKYFVALTAKSISATAGRAVGQVFLTAASNTYTPTNDSGTTLNLFIIDAETLEIVDIHKAFYKENMAKPEELKKVEDGFTNYLLSL